RYAREADDLYECGPALAGHGAGVAAAHRIEGREGGGRHDPEEVRVVASGQPPHGTTRRRSSCRTVDSTTDSSIASIDSGLIVSLRLDQTSSPLATEYTLVSRATSSDPFR